MVPEETQESNVMMVANGEHVSSMMIPEISQLCSNLVEAVNVEEANNRASVGDVDTILDQEFVGDEFVLPFLDPVSSLEIQGSARSVQCVNGSCSSPFPSELLTSRVASSGGFQLPNVSADTSFPNNYTRQNPQTHFPFFNDPYDYEMEKLRRENENSKKKFDETTSELLAELERKMAEVRSEYDKQSRDKDAAYNAKVKEEETIRSFVVKNSLLANAFTFKCSETSLSTDVASIRGTNVHPQQQAVQTNTHVYSSAPPLASITTTEALLQLPRVTMSQPTPISHQAVRQPTRYVMNSTATAPPRPSVTAAEAPLPQTTTHVNPTVPPQPSVTARESQIPNPSAAPLPQFPRWTPIQPKPISQQARVQPNTHVNASFLPRVSVMPQPRPISQQATVQPNATSLPRLSVTSQPRPPPIIPNLTPSSTPPQPVGGIVRAMAPHLRSSRPPNPTASPTPAPTTTYPRRMAQEAQQQQQQQGKNSNSNSGLVYLSDDEE